MLKDSTRVEKDLFRLFFNEEPLEELTDAKCLDTIVPTMAMFVNCAGLNEQNQEMQRLKMHHELQLD